jgi:hypothetical protein
MNTQLKLPMLMIVLTFFAVLFVSGGSFAKSSPCETLLQKTTWVVSGKTVMGIKSVKISNVSPPTSSGGPYILTGKVTTSFTTGSPFHPFFNGECYVTGNQIVEITFPTADLCIIAMQGQTITNSTNSFVAQVTPTQVTPTTGTSCNTTGELRTITLNLQK